MKKTELSWSLFHPSPLDIDYMKKIVGIAKNSDVDSFEICGDCHTVYGGMDGLCLYEKYPEVNSAIDAAAILSNREKLRAILNLAHSIEKKVYYWHREVTVPAGMIEAHPELLDENGEFDLLGKPFEALLSYKIEQTFTAVPELDGLVLTLTEADFSAIHNSTPDKYPPVQVVKHIVSIFAENCKKYQRRFILRSFGSIAQDYEDILGGAKLAAQKYGFEVETKITPYDFNPFLPENPFLYPMKNLTLSAECDSLGEFLGAGFLPAENVDNIVKYVKFAQKQEIDRFAIRLDRVGNSILDLYFINLFAYTEAIRHADITADEIREKFAQKYYPEKCRAELLQLGKAGFEMITHLNYIDGNLIFHEFPPKADLKWLKAGGFFSSFAENQPLKNLSGIWSILSSKNSVGAAAVIREKEQALEMAQAALRLLDKIKPDCPVELYQTLRRLWGNAETAALSLLEFCRCVAAYFADMRQRRNEPIELNAAFENMKQRLMPLLKDKNLPEIKLEFFNGMGHVFKKKADYSTMDGIYLKPLIGMVQILQMEYASEIRIRQKYENKNVIECIIPGSITDDYRCKRYMHGSHALLTEDGKIGRFAGNQVFPNGFVEYHFESSGILRIAGEGKNLKISLNGAPAVEYPLHDGLVSIKIPADATVKIQKGSALYPLLFALTLEREIK